MRPDARKTIRLKLLHDGESIRLGPTEPPLSALYLLRDAEQVLNVVSYLVRDDVCLSEIAGGVEPFLEVSVEAQVYVYLLVGRAVERSHRGLGEASCGVSGPGE